MIEVHSLYAGNGAGTMSVQKDINNFAKKGRIMAIVPRGDYLWVFVNTAIDGYPK